MTVVEILLVEDDPADATGTPFIAFFSLKEHFNVNFRALSLMRYYPTSKSAYRL